MGYKQIETYLQEFMQKVVLKLATQDILKDLENIDLENDKEQQVSRNLAQMLKIILRDLLTKKDF